MSDKKTPAGEPTKKSGNSNPSGKPLPDPGKVSTRLGSPGSGKSSKDGGKSKGKS